ncbi:MAG: hydantoinase B/oxoprolinase family protein, partial [Burkholderiales bacterium]|nr:hydantoinase B/oxoprolinase family protein [Burkholderiales bacterium]
RAVFAPRGLYGGGNGSFATLFLERDDGSMEKIPSKYGSHIKRGQHLRIMTPGGGGFGDPGQRDRAALKRDFLDGKVTAEKIKQDYGVDIRAEDARN